MNELSITSIYDSFYGLGCCVCRMKIRCINNLVHRGEHKGIN